MNNPNMTDLLVHGGFFVSEVTERTLVSGLVNVRYQLGSEVETAVMRVQVAPFVEGFDLITKSTGVLHALLGSLGLSLNGGFLETLWLDMKVCGQEIFYFLVSTTDMAHNFHRVPELFVTIRTLFFFSSNQLNEFLFVMDIAVVPIESLLV